ncbi:MAG: ribonuclease H-like domain-containing protein [Lachnospiraceae bacterium]|nr:ribonuclease H-like domain-containing protein [Lachnospiraceae bacterium]
MTDSYVCIDLETTGLDPKRDKIIEIGAVRVERGEITETWETFVNPGQKLSERIVELTGIHDRDLSRANPIGDLLPGLFAFLGEDVLLGHSILFDFSFLKKAAVNERLVFERQGIDTLKIARKYLKDLESRSLGALCKHYGISHSAHRALGDACATNALYRKLAEEFYEKEEAAGEKSLFQPKPLIYRAKRDTPLTAAQKEQLYKLLDRHKLIVDYKVENLTRSEASRKIDQILAAYGR